MNADLSQVQTSFQSSLPHVLDLIKMENPPSPQFAHTNLSRAVVFEKNSKALDLESKQHRQTISALTNNWISIRTFSRAFNATFWYF